MRDVKNKSRAGAGNRRSLLARKTTSDPAEDALGARRFCARRLGSLSLVVVDRRRTGHLAKHFVGITSVGSRRHAGLIGLIVITYTTERRGSMGRGERRSLTGCGLFRTCGLLLLLARQGLVRLSVRVDMGLRAKLWRARLLLELRVSVDRN